MRRVTVVGLGLIGGSLALALRRARPRVEVVGVDRPGVLTAAMEREVVDVSEPDPQKALAVSEVVFLATPIDTIGKLIQDLAHDIPSGMLVTDVGSIKRPILEKASLLPSSVQFIGGHPMAGKETSGLDAAEPDLFRGASWALVPRHGTASEAIVRLSRLIRALGARPVVLDATVHDRAVAVVSHLPQLLAVMLCEQADRVEHALELAGPAFHSLGRLSRSPYPLWREVLKSNRDLLGEAVSELSERLQQAKTDLETDRLLAHFESARKVLSKRTRG